MMLSAKQKDFAYVFSLSLAPLKSSYFSHESRDKTFALPMPKFNESCFEQYFDALIVLELYLRLLMELN